MRVCTKCESSGPFYKDSRIKDGQTALCQQCTKLDHHQRYERTKTRHIAKVKEWQLAHPDLVRQYKVKNGLANQDRGKIWHWAHLEKARARCRQWAKDNRDQHNAHRHTYRSRQAKAGGSYTDSQWKELCRQHDNRCAACGAQAPLTADHVVPVCKGGSSNIDNIQPLCKSCNLKKGTKTTDYRIWEGRLRWIQPGLF